MPPTDLAEYAEWNAQLHAIGEAEVKHGARIRVFNLYNGEVGNAQLLKSFDVSDSLGAAAC